MFALPLQELNHQNLAKLAEQILQTLGVASFLFDIGDVEYLRRRVERYAPVLPKPIVGAVFDSDLSAGHLLNGEIHCSRSLK